MNIPHKTNISNKERAALKKRMDNKNIIIKNADKGGGIVILNQSDYLEEANRILSDKNYYQPLKSDPSKQFHEQYMHLITQAYQNKILNKKELKFLDTKSPITPIFYNLPKIHKSVEKPPGRPIIAGVGFLTSGLSQYIDRLLQKYVILLPSYLKDTTSIIQEFHSIKWQDNYMWATLDVTALYSNIPHDLGIASIGSYLSKDTNMPPLQKQFILDSIHFILKHNFFEFDTQLYI